VPTVNIGTRQAGRLRARSIIDCEPRRDAIVTAIETALSPEFLAGLACAAPPYGRPASASGKIAATLRQVDLRALRVKQFYDIHEAGGS